MISARKTIIILFMIGGAATMMVLRAINERKDGFGTVGNSVVGIVAILLVIWNVLMYRKARRIDDPENPRSRIERYMSPVAATISFLIGFLLFAI